MTLFIRHFTWLYFLFIVLVRLRDFKGFSISLALFVAELGRVLRTVGERQFALYVILLLGFMFSLTGCPFCLLLSLPLIGVRVKKLCVRRKQNRAAPTAATATATEEDEESNQIDNSIATSLKLSPFCSLTQRLFWWSVECVFIASLCVNNRFVLSIRVRIATDTTIVPHICHTGEFIVKGLSIFSVNEESVVYRSLPTFVLSIDL